MGDRCLRSVILKVRIDEMAQPLGDWLTAFIIVLGEPVRAEVGASKRTRLFVLFIAVDAFSVVILVSLSSDLKFAKQIRVRKILNSRQ